MIKKTRASFFQRSPPKQYVVRGMLYQGQQINSQVRSLEVLYVTPSALIQTPRLWLKHRSFTQAPGTVTQARKTYPTTEFCDVTLSQATNTDTSIEHFDWSTDNCDWCNDHRDSSTEHRDSSTEHRVSSTEHRDSSTEHRDSSTEHCDSSTQNLPKHWVLRGNCDSSTKRSLEYWALRL